MLDKIAVYILYALIGTLVLSGQDVVNFLLAKNGPSNAENAFA